MQRLSDLAGWLGLEAPEADVALSGAAIDTRQLLPGQLFIALPGSRADGHDFVAAAADAGAAAALVARRVAGDLPQLVVADVLAAMQQLAACWRRAWGGRVVAVTGSNGKTSVKTLLAQILGRQHRMHATQGNLNNHIGLPLTLLNVRPEHQLAVLEMGANHLGEIAQLAGWAQPDVGIVTQAGDAHLEGFGSRDGVAHGKGELFEALGPDGVAVINADDVYAPLWRGLAAPARTLSFGRSPSAEVRALDEHNGPDEQRFTLHLPGHGVPVRLPLPGRHSVMNALAAAAACHALDVPIEDIVAGLGEASAVAGRLQAQRLASGAQLFDDSYNANPGSFAAALDVLAACPPARHFVLGDMAELGEQAQALHAEAGRAIAAAGIEHFWACGPLSAYAARAYGPRARHFEHQQALAAELSAALGRGDTVLIKGSRSAGMDRVVDILTGEAGA